MAQLVVEKSGPKLFGFHLQRFLGQKHKQDSLQFDDDGKATRQLSKGTYAVGWALTGSAGDQWKYSVTLDGTAIETNEGTLTHKTRSEGGAIRVEVTE